jgi:hypothetical protein
MKSTKPTPGHGHSRETAATARQRWERLVRYPAGIVLFAFERGRRATASGSPLFSVTRFNLRSKHA